MKKLINKIFSVCCICSNLSECLCVHSIERSSSPVRASRAKGREGVSRRCQEEGQRSMHKGRSVDRDPPPSPIHNALGQVCAFSFPEVSLKSTETFLYCNYFV